MMEPVLRPIGRLPSAITCLRRTSFMVVGRSSTVVVVGARSSSLVVALGRRPRRSDCSGTRRAQGRRDSVERDASIPQRDVGVVADHQVVQQADIQEAPGGQCLGRQVKVIG